jgi:hypothetical protein
MVADMAWGAKAWRQTSGTATWHKTLAIGLTQNPLVPVWRETEQELVDTQRLEKVRLPGLLNCFQQDHI